MPQIQVKVNTLNSVHLAGEIVDIKQLPDTLVIVKLKLSTGKLGNGSLTINCKFEKLSRTPLVGERIHVYGNLRYSEDTKSYKVLASDFSYTGASDLNIVYAELTLLPATAREVDGIHELSFMGFNVSKRGALYTLPIPVTLGDKQYKACKTMLIPYDRYFVEASLYKDGATLKLAGLHVKSADGIFIPLDI